MNTSLQVVFERKDEGGRVEKQVLLMLTLKDRFVHFTTEARALQILATGKLLFNPPYRKMGIDAVTAISLTFGKFEPRVQTDHLKKLGSPLVAILFQTNTTPEYGRRDEVVWESDVVLRKPKMVPYKDGVAALSRTNLALVDDCTVYYDTLPAPIEAWIARQRSARLAARFKRKKQVPKADGSGKTTVYEYSERQIQNRHKEKADRLEKLRKGLADLRSQVRKDLKSKDEKTRLTALAVALIDETYERVGNDESAESGHFGVTGWRKKHIKLSPSKATISYVGKSGVSQKKTVTTPGVVSVLRDALRGKSDSDGLFDLDDGAIRNKQVNEYLKEFDITAKDLRGLHANQEMQRCLKQIRKDGPKLPTDVKEREKLLKDEFLKALDEVADRVGHESATLRKQYLVPGLEEDFMDDGKVNNSLKKSSKQKTAIIHIDNARPNPKGSGHLEGEVGLLSSLTAMERVLVKDMIRSGDAIYHIGDYYYFRGYDVRPDVVTEILWSGYLREDENKPGVIRISDALEAKLALYKTATKSKSDKEDDHADEQVKREPEYKPPRSDKRKRRMTEDDPDMVDAGGAGKDPDLSLNYKGRTASGSSGRGPGDIWETDEGWWGINSGGSRRGFYGEDARAQAQDWASSHPEEVEEEDESPSEKQTPSPDTSKKTPDTSKKNPESPGDDWEKLGVEDLNPEQRKWKIQGFLKKLPRNVQGLMEESKDIAWLYDNTPGDLLSPAERADFELLTRYVCAEKLPESMPPAGRLVDKFILHHQKRSNFDAVRRQMRADDTPTGIVTASAGMSNSEFAEFAIEVDPAFAPIRQALGKTEEGLDVLSPQQAKWLREFTSSLLGHMDVLTDEIDHDTRDEVERQLEKLTATVARLESLQDNAREAGNESALALASRILETKGPSLDKATRLRMEEAVKNKDARLLGATVDPDLLKKKRASLSPLFIEGSRRELSNARAGYQTVTITGRGSTMKMTKTAAKALAITALLDRVASQLEGHPTLDRRVAADFTRRCDAISDILERTAGIRRNASGKIAGFDPEDIGRETDGPSEFDADEDWMSDEFSQQENRELRDLFEDGDLDSPNTNLFPRSSEPGRQASLAESLSRLTKRASEADTSTHTLGNHIDDLRLCAKQLSKSEVAAAKSLATPVSKLVTALSDAQELLIEAQADGKGGLLSLPLSEILSALDDACPHIKDVTQRVLTVRAENAPTSMVRLEELLTRDGGKYASLAEHTTTIVNAQVKAMDSLLKAAE